MSGALPFVVHPADAPFADKPLAQGTFAVTFDHHLRAGVLDAGATITRPDGRITPFRLHLRDPQRIAEFQDGIGALIALADPGDDPHQPAHTLTAFGAWEKTTHDAGVDLVFVLAEWSWLDHAGVKHHAGWPPLLAPPRGHPTFQG